MVVLFVNSAQMMIVREYKEQIKKDILRKLKLQQKCKINKHSNLIKRYAKEIDKLTKDLDYWYTMEEKIKSR